MLRPLLACLLALAALTAPAASAHAAAPPNPVQVTLGRLVAQGRLSQQAAAAKLSVYRALRAGSHRPDLPAATRAALAGSAETARALARRGRLAARVTPVFADLQATHQWLLVDRKALPAAGARVELAPSRVIYQWVAGAGWQVHPLANLGRLNAMGRDPRVKPATLTGYADELLALTVDRDGTPAWEYMFAWYEADPGWTSAMATATGVSALARVSARTGNPAYAQAGERMLAIFDRPAPRGVLGTGGRLLLYSGTPGLLVGNGFAQAVIGLHEYATLTGSPHALKLYRDAERVLRRDLPGYDTGAWSLYSLPGPDPRAGHESDLAYHRLFTEFLDNLCQRLGPTGGAPYCQTAARFHAYEDEPVRLSGLHARALAGAVELSVRASKTSRLKVTLSDPAGRHAPVTVSAAGVRATNRITLPRPPAGRYTLTVTATGLTGASAQTSTRVTVPRVRRA